MRINILSIFSCFLLLNNFFIRIAYGHRVSLDTESVKYETEGVKGEDIVALFNVTQ